MHNVIHSLIINWKNKIAYKVFWKLDKEIEHIKYSKYNKHSKYIKKKYFIRLSNKMMIKYLKLITQ